MAFLTVRNHFPPHSAIELLMNLTVCLILAYGDEVYRYVFLSLFPFIKKENPPSQHGCCFLCCCLLCDWSSIQHSSMLPVFSLAFAPSLQKEPIVSGHLQTSHWGKPFSTVIFLIFTTLITVSVLVASPLSSYRELRPP